MGQPRPLFVLFSFFSITILQKIVDLSGIRTRIVGVEGQHVDHLTTTTAHVPYMFDCWAYPLFISLY